MMRMGPAIAIVFVALSMSCASTQQTNASTTARGANETHVPPPDVATLSCGAIAKLTAAQKRAVVDEQRELFDWKRARCALDKGDVEEARTLSQRFTGERGAAMRDFVEVLAALHEGREAHEVKDLLSVWVSTGHADARAFVKEPALRKLSAESWYVDMALSAWDSDRQARRSPPLKQFVKDLATFTDKPFIEGAARTIPGALTIVQGQIINHRVDGEIAHATMASLDVGVAVADQRTWSEGRRTEYHGNVRITGPDAMVTQTETVETFSVNGHTFLADVPAFTTKWNRLVIVGVMVGGREGDDAPLVRGLLVLPRVMRSEENSVVTPTEFPRPPLWSPW